MINVNRIINLKKAGLHLLIIRNQNMRGNEYYGNKIKKPAGLVQVIYGMIFNSRGNSFLRDKLDAILLAGFFGYGLVTGIEFKKKLTDTGRCFGFSWIGKRLFSRDWIFD